MIRTPARPLLLCVSISLVASAILAQPVRRVDVTMEDGTTQTLTPPPATQPATQPAVVLAPSYHFLMGANLAKNSEAGTTAYFTNACMTFAGGGSDWSSQGWGMTDKPWTPIPDLKLTDSGYPLQDAGAYSYMRGYPAGRYAFHYDGKATVEFKGKGKLADARTVVIGSNPDQTVIINVRNPDPADPPRNFSLVPEGWDATFVWSPPFRDAVKRCGLKYLRPMDLLNSNRHPRYASGDRLRAEDWRQVGPKGVAWEYVCALPRETGCGLWVNVPWSYDDAAAFTFAAFVKASVPPGTSVTWEPSNELWNTSFDQGINVRAVAAAQKCSFGQAVCREAYRLMKAVRQASDASDDWRYCLPLQAANASLTKELLDEWRAQGGGVFTDACISGYFNIDLGSETMKDGGDDKKLDDLEKAGKDTEALDFLFARLSDQTATPSAKRQQQRALVRGAGLGLRVYEWGSHVTGYNPYVRSYLALKTKDAMRKDPRLTTFYASALAALERDYGPFSEAPPACHFDFVEAGGRDGYWQLLDDVSQQTSPKADAVKAYPSGQAVN